MIDWFFFIGMVIIITWIASYRNVQIEKQIEKRRRVVTCPPHKWQYFKQPGLEFGYLQCVVCKKFPGVEREEEL
jgi:hypothetical protein